MDNTEKTDRRLDFVTGHYRDDAFDVDAGWRSVSGRLWHGNVRPWFISRRVAAAIAAGVVLTASACLLTWTFVTQTDSQAEIQSAEVTASDKSKVATEVKRIEFVDATLPEVIEAIECIYGVKVTNMPAEEYRLTLSYEGTAADLIATINDLLGIGLKIEE
ncbi:MAG: 50S ribosomal protein L23 [Muribaculaceae bacterium]|nr:50S ribosomal protein L23 [Muribaculaceae bacterium]